MHALVRRASRVSPEDLYVIEDVIVDFSKTEVTRCGEKVTVTAKEFKTLEFFTRNADRTISRNEFLNEVWGRQNSLYPNGGQPYSEVTTKTGERSVTTVTLSHGTLPGL